MELGQDFFFFYEMEPKLEGFFRFHTITEHMVKKNQCLVGFAPPTHSTKFVFGVRSFYKAIGFPPKLKITNFVNHSRKIHFKNQKASQFS
jgi:hypothetical protein